MIGQVCAGLRFYSRLPVPSGAWDRDPHGVPDFRRLAPVVPLVGLLLAVPPAAALWLGDQLGLGPRLAAMCSVVVVLVTTGAFHEDGLADTADSLGAWTVERRLEVMQDSRIGTFGASALVLSLLVRVEAIALVVERGSVVAAVGALLAVGAVSRAAPLLMLVRLPAARPGGLAHAVGVPGGRQVATACVTGAVLAVGVGAVCGLPAVALALLLALAGLAAEAAVRFARRHVGGHTGDISGACQQVVEVVSWLLLAATL